MKNKIQIAAGIISLVALLTYTMIHTGGLLARYINPPAIGYVAALGIEIAIVSLSLRIGDSRRYGLDSRWFLFVLVSVVVVSALANVYEGFHTFYGEPLTVANMGQLDIIQAVVGLSATGLISLIVLALAEIIGSDVQVMAAQAEKQRRDIARKTPIDTGNTEVLPQNEAQIAAINAEKVATKEDKKRKLATILEEQPDANNTALATMLDVSRGTVRNYRQELNGNHKHS
jgi:hypothetical protein